MRTQREIMVLLVVVAAVALMASFQRRPAAPPDAPSSAASGTSRASKLQSASGIASNVPNSGANEHWQTPYAIRGVRLGMSTAEVQAAVGLARNVENSDAEDATVRAAWIFDDEANAPLLAKVCFDADGKAVRIEGRVLEAANGVIFARPVQGLSDVERAFGLAPDRSQTFQLLPLKDGSTLEITCADVDYFRLFSAASSARRE